MEANTSAYNHDDSCALSINLLKMKVERDEGLLPEKKNEILKSLDQLMSVSVETAKFVVANLHGLFTKTNEEAVSGEPTVSQETDVGSVASIKRHGRPGRRSVKRAKTASPSMVAKSYMSSGSLAAVATAKHSVAATKALIIQHLERLLSADGFNPRAVQLHQQQQALCSRVLYR
ncbi:hypothetical protein BDF20DRAFT_93897 [Mycotypha africana]|uniref:uncharacterized protein n=1 Tax=Mycotypha africana TaxID=64632 RepID=UPI002300FA40|nr:uncharacterized protein BDF20DRAFT_93897 [Mycotypha africana]KAI8969903.1 hypothetical protein BDF20DRAFT_93897 [Mycotypha africana]